MGVFHPGERQAQQKAGTTGVADELGRSISDHLALETGVSRLFDNARFIVLCFKDENERIWVRPVFGKRGFLRAKSRNIVAVEVGEDAGGQLQKRLKPGMDVAILVLDLERRSRYRTMGVVIDDGSSAGKTLKVVFEVREAFPNCPKYIQRRVLDIESSESIAMVKHPKCCWDTRLSEQDNKIVEDADCLFLGTYYEKRGSDVNHRGGNPGFVRICSDTELIWPEYRGNGMFQSSGNLELDDRAGLLFIDYRSGNLIQISGKAQVEWNSKESIDGSRRLMRFHIEKILRSFGATQYRWSLVEYSPYNPLLTGKSGASSEEQAMKGQIFPVTVSLAKIKRESPSVTTFRFIAPTIVPFLPGQYATFIFRKVPTLTTNDEQLERTWTISETPNSVEGDNTIEISVKLVPGGRVSTWLHQLAKIGLKVLLIGIDGEMTPITGMSLENPSLDRRKELRAPEKLLLISGGIGITPNLAIVRGLGSFRISSDVVFLHCERFERDLPFQVELQRRVEQHGNIKLTNFITQCTDGAEIIDKRFSRCGRLSSRVIKELVPNLSSREVYLCGPELFMQMVSKMLVNLGVNASSIHIEKFNF